MCTESQSYSEEPGEGCGMSRGMLVLAGKVLLAVCPSRWCCLLRICSEDLLLVILCSSAISTCLNLAYCHIGGEVNKVMVEIPVTLQ